LATPVALAMIGQTTLGGVMANKDRGSAKPSQKKQPQKSLKEKRAEKKQKKAK